MEKAKKEPLLYIHQPDLPLPDIKVQEFYIDTGIENNIPEPPLLQDDQKMEQKVEMPINQESQEHGLSIGKNMNAQPSVAIQEAPQLRKPSSSVDYFRKSGSKSTRGSISFKPATPFRQLTIKEKIQYVVGLSNQQPPFACEFVTDGKNYKGTISKHGEHEIEVHTFAEGEVAIPIQDIKDIRLIG